MSEPEQKCENNCAVFKQNYTEKLLITFKLAYSCCFGLGGNLDFPDFSKFFYNIDYSSSNIKYEGKELYAEKINKSVRYCFCRRSKMSQEKKLNK